MQPGDLPLGRTAARGLSSATEVVAKLRAALPVSAVVLFGSRATGEYTQQSDWDVVVVSPLFAHEEAMFRRAQTLLAALEPVRGIDPVGLAPDELAALDCLLVLDAVADGVPLYDDGCFDRARTRLAEYLTRGERERLGGGWRISDT